MILLLAKALLLLCAADVAAWLERACGLSFSNRAVELRYQQHRQRYLARSDANVGLAVGVMGILLMVRIASRGGSHWGFGGSARPTLSFVVCVLPCLLARAWGADAYARRRVKLILAQRVALLAIVLVPGAHVFTDAPPTTVWHTAGRLLMAVRSFPLLALPLGFQLSPLRTLLLQAASVALAGARVAPACAYQDLRAPTAREGMRAICEWLGSLPAFLPLPLPPASPPARLDLCHALCLWLLTCWHLVLPFLWALVSDARARQAFVARRRAADELSVTERAWWAGLVVPPVWLVPLAVVPVLSLALWRLAMVMLGP